jgi:hypothetical protein
MHASAEDVGDADSGGDTGARAGGASGGGGVGGGGCGGGGSTNMPCTRCGAKVKQEKDGVGEQLADKGELQGMSCPNPRH